MGDKLSFYIREQQLSSGILAFRLGASEMQCDKEVTNWFGLVARKS